MGKVAVSLKIDVTKIDKARLFKGQKGTYLDATIFLDLGEADQYGNHGMITQDVSKEEREAGNRGEILGNGKIVWRDGGEAATPASARQAPAARQQTSQQTSQQPATAQDYDSFDDDIPF